MHDSDIEDLLRRYQPVGPPPGLEARIVSDVPARRVWPWAAAAAALLALTIGLQAATDRLATQADVPPNSTASLVDDLTESLGGDDAARRLAEVMVVELQIRTELAVDQ